MKIGFSFGKCIRDIVTGVVKLEDVLLIVARTKASTIEEIISIVKQYMNDLDRLHGLDREECIAVATHLFQSGKIHMPRNYGTYYYGGVDEQFVWMDAIPSQINETPAVKEAWDQYRMLLTMCGNGEALPTLEEARFKTGR